ncbi:MAG: ATP-grasp domain-containing protein [Nitriliruptorales bacterium]|nr:ATP-grasp domain-containing protein [Nitriliruptorales bacterium]
MVFAAFVAPFLLEATVRFADSAARLPGVDLAVITHEPAEHLPARLRESLVAHWQVDDALDPAQLVDAVRGLSRQRRPVDGLLGVLEQAQVPIARAREVLGLSGMDVRVATNFRDKNQMKDVLRAAGVPVAAHRLVGGPEAAIDFAAEVGFPLVVKPPAGAGARSTFRLDDAVALRRWIEASPPSASNPTLVEEFLAGQEFTFDSVMVDGRVEWYSIARYLPAPLEVLHHPWMQWAVLLPRDIGGDDFDDIRAIAPAALSALGLQTGLSHMEWFRRADGTIAVSEVGARPPGAQLTSALSYAHCIDLYVEWPRLMLLHEFAAPQRLWAVGVVYLRGHGAGRVTAVRGAGELHRELGDLVVEAKLPQIGQAPSGTYEGEGYVIVRHEETDVVVHAMQELLTRLRVELG